MLQKRSTLKLAGRVIPEEQRSGIVRLANFTAPIVTPRCPLGYLGYSFLKFESRNKFSLILFSEKSY
jgi:hypothetical protein